MRKKYLNALLFGALVTASTGTFTSCKDYDDDIDRVQKQVDENKKAIDATLASKVAELEAAIAKAQSQADKGVKDAAAAMAEAKAKATPAELKALEVAMKAAIKAVEDASQEKLDGVKAELVNIINGKVDKTTMKDYATNSQLQDAVKSLEAALHLLENASKEEQTKLGQKIEALTKRVAANEVAIKNLQAELATKASAKALNELNKTVETLGVTVDKQGKDIETLKKGLAAVPAQIQAETAAALTAAKDYAKGLVDTAVEKQDKTNKAVTEKLDALKKGLDTVTSDLKTLSTTVGENTAAIGENSTKIEDLTKKLSEDVLKLQNSIADNLKKIEANSGKIETNAGNIETNKQSIQATSEALNSFKKAQEALNGTFTEGIAKLTENLKEANEHLGKVEGIATGAQETATKATGLANNAQKTADEATKLAKELQNEISKVTSDLKKFIDETYATDKTANENAHKQLDDKIAKANNKLKALTERVTTLETDYKNLKASVDTNTTAIGDNKDAIGNNTTAIGANSDSINVNKTAIAKLAENLKTLNTNLEKCATVEYVDNQVKLLREYIDSQFIASDVVLKLKLNLLNKSLLKVVGERLTSLNYVADTYMNGIETMAFNSFKFKEWSGKDDIKNDAATGKDVLLTKKNTTVQYLVSPANINLSDVVKWSFIANDKVSNTRAVVESPIEIVTEGPNAPKVENGVLTLNVVKKTSNKPFANGEEGFMTVALKAELKPLQQGQATSYVFSDFARLTEDVVTPYLHKADAKVEFAENNVNNANWLFNQRTVMNSEAGECVLKTIELADAKNGYDLSKLVDVMTGRGEATGHQQSVAYGEGKTFKLEFELTSSSYTLNNDGPFGQAVYDQQQFAEIKDGKIYPKSYKDTQLDETVPANGHEPVVRVKLVTNDGKVADVRYFKIKWGIEKVDLGIIETKSDIVFDKTTCDQDFKLGISEKVLNKALKEIAYKLHITEDAFKNDYQLVAAHIAHNDKGAEDATLGTLVNNEWTVAGANLTPSAKEVEQGKMTKVAYFQFKKSGANDPVMVTFGLQMNFNIAKIDRALGYTESYWLGNVTTEEKTMLVNPILQSDKEYGKPAGNATCQITSDMKTGYLDVKAEKGQPTNVLALVKNAADAKFEFVSGPKGYTVNEADKTQLMKGTEVAATIDANGRIWLKETNAGAADSKATEAALGLVGNSVKVALVGSYCKVSEKVDAFNVKFDNVLKMTIKQPTESLVDLKDNGSSIALNGIVTVREDFPGHNSVVTAGTDLAKWYGFKGVEFDVDNAKANIVKVTDEQGRVSYKVSEGKFETNLTDLGRGLTINTDKIEYVNNFGTQLVSAFKVRIPIKATSKWQPVLTDGAVDYIELTVKPAK